MSYKEITVCPKQMFMLALYKMLSYLQQLWMEKGK